MPGALPSASARPDPPDRSREMHDSTDLFVRACVALYGELWQSRAGRELAISDRHMRRIAAGEAPVKPGMLADLHRLLNARREAIGEIMDEISAHDTTDPERQPR